MGPSTNSKLQKVIHKTWCKPLKRPLHHVYCFQPTSRLSQLCPAARQLHWTGASAGATGQQLLVAGAAAAANGPSLETVLSTATADLPWSFWAWHTDHTLRHGLPRTPTSPQYPFKLIKLAQRRHATCTEKIVYATTLKRFRGQLLKDVASISEMHCKGRPKPFDKFDRATMVWCANDASWGGFDRSWTSQSRQHSTLTLRSITLTTVTKSNWAQEQPHWNSRAVLWTQRVDAPPPLHSNSCRANRGGVTINRQRSGSTVKKRLQDP